MVTSHDALPSIDTDLLVLPWFEDEPASAMPGVDAATGGEIGRALASSEFQAKPYDMFLALVSDRTWRARQIALIGAGRRPQASGDIVRKLASAAAHAARKRHVARMAFAVRATWRLSLIHI